MKHTINLDIQEIIKKSRDGESFTREELIRMLEFPAHSAESFALMAEARRISVAVSDGKAEIHGQFALDLAPCPCNCMWCSFSQKNNVFQHQWRISVEEAVDLALKFERQGANAILAMTTSGYPFGLYLDMAKEIKRHLKPDTVFIANTSDKSLSQARQMKDAGFAGVYHALRLREGIENDLDPAQRLESIRNFQEAGLWVGTCVEPIGPEHTNEEIAEMILFTASLRPAFSGAARRIAIPGTAMAERGMISELRMSQCVAVTRLAMPRETRGNCTHEPCALGTAAGANLLWAEIGANPRDDQEKTEEHRGKDVADCRNVYLESDWEILEGPSMHYLKAPAPLPGIDIWNEPTSRVHYN
jgi:biotin synthase